jgi:hypothetical protein
MPLLIVIENHYMHINVCMQYYFDTVPDVLYQIHTCLLFTYFSLFLIKSLFYFST